MTSAALVTGSGKVDNVKTKEDWRVRSKRLDAK